MEQNKRPRICKLQNSKQLLFVEVFFTLKININYTKKKKLRNVSRKAGNHTFYRKIMKRAKIVCKIEQKSEEKKVPLLEAQKL